MIFILKTESLFLTSHRSGIAGSQGHRRALHTTEELSVSSTSHWDWGQGPWLSSWWHDLSRVSNLWDLYLDENHDIAISSRADTDSMLAGGI